MLRPTTFWPFAVAVYSAAGALGAGLESGLQPGDLATPFNVTDVTGPNQGISLCYR